MGPTIRVDGQWLSTVVASWGDLEVTHGRNGPVAASWSMAMLDDARPECLTRNAVVEIYTGPRSYWSGTLGEPDWSSLTFTAIGIARAGEAAECLNGSGQVTSKLNTAIDQAIARGVVGWVRGADFGNTDLAGPEGGAGVDDPNPGKLNELLDAWASENGKQWRVSASGLLTWYVEDETAPSWLVLPGAAVMGVADDDVTDRVFLRYRSSSAGQLRTASYPAATPPGGIERRATIVDLGAMTSTRATNIAEGIYNKLLAGRTGWSNAIEVSPEQVTDLGGNPADLTLIRAGESVRVLGARDPRGATRYIDVVIDETRYQPGERTILLQPVGMVAHTWEQVLADAGAVSAT